MVAIEQIDSTERLGEFAGEWRQFAGRLGPPTPFQTPQWLLTWWSCMGSGRPHVLVFREGGQTAGIVPCFLHQWRGRRQLTLLGTGVSDYLDPLLDQPHEAAILDRLRAHLAHFTEWDLCDWQDLSAETPLRVLGDATEDTSCSYVPLQSSYKEFLEARSSQLRRNLRRYLDKANSRGHVRFTVTAEPDGTLLNALMDLHAARWRQAGEAGMIEVNHSAGFLRAVTPVMACNGALRFFTLYFQGSIAAILLALCQGATIFSYLSAFNPDYEAYGFGRELLARAFEYAHREGFRFWNFLRGDEPYKLSWGAQPIPKCRLRFEQV